MVQRFSGSGLPPERQTRNRERNARRATLTLAVVMALALVCSAALLFDPNAFRSGFGLALGQRLSSLSSDTPLILPGTEPPTAAPTDATTPTATPQGGGGGVPTATPSATNGLPTATTIPPTATSTSVPPTATPVAPTPTPTPPIGKSATVTIKSATQNKQTSGNLNGCPNGSGCNFADTYVNVGGHSVSSNWQGTWVNAYLQGTISFQTDNPNYGCSNCVVGYPAVSWNGTNCLENPYTVNIPKGGSYNATCTIPLYNPT
ncbi:MAG TPA: hypothetical protein VGR88_07925, partial [Ktedonobacterales bacterium]|nr:hypothetical protein [Ktedonobacterales bacterium]